MSTICSYCIILAIHLLLYIDISSSMNCESLTIRCNSGEPNCYQSSLAQCGVMASHLSGINRLPLHITPSPTILVIPQPVLTTTTMPTNHDSPNRLPTRPTITTPRPTRAPNNPTTQPTNRPSTLQPTISPTNNPITTQPSNHPSTLQPTVSPSNNPSTTTTTSQPTVSPTTQPTNHPNTLHPTVIITTQRPSTFPTELPTESGRCVACHCDCSICTEPEQCMRTGPDCIWLTSVCTAIPSITITNTPTTSLPTAFITSTTSIIPISCDTHHINGLYSDQVVIFEFTVQSLQTVTFDACHSDLVPILRLFKHDTNTILNECDLLHGCCALNPLDSGLITDLLPGVYYFEFDYDREDRKRFTKDHAIYHIHIDCKEVDRPSPVIDIVPTRLIPNPTSLPTPNPTSFPTPNPTPNPTSQATNTNTCTSCSCDCSRCTDSGQCMSIGPYCIWLTPVCIAIPSVPIITSTDPTPYPTSTPTPTPTSYPPTTSPTTIPSNSPITRKPTPHPSTKPPSKSPTTTSPTADPTEACPQLGESCTSALHKDVRCCNGNRQLGFARCYYTEYDSVGYKLGTCCVRKHRPGCTKEADCCGNKRSCYSGYCLDKRGTGYMDSGDERSAITILEDGEYAEWADIDRFEDDEKVFGLYRASKIVGIIVLVVCVMCNVVYYYFKYVRNRKKEEHESDADTDIGDDYTSEVVL